MLTCKHYTPPYSGSKPFQDTSGFINIDRETSHLANLFRSQTHVVRVKGPKAASSDKDKHVYNRDLLYNTIPTLPFGKQTNGKHKARTYHVIFGRVRFAIVAVEEG